MDIKFYNAEDYCGVYVDGELLVAGHEPSPFWILEKLAPRLEQTIEISVVEENIDYLPEWMWQANPKLKTGFPMFQDDLDDLLSEYRLWADERP